MNSTLTELPTKSTTQVIEDIRVKLTEKPRREGSAYTMIVGAGFSYGVVPLTKELLHERIGDFYYALDKTLDGSIERSRRQAEKLSRDYWKEFNSAGSLAGEPLVELDRKGLPVNPSLAYQNLFTYRTANALFAASPAPSFSPWLDRIKRQRGLLEPQPRVIAGEKFVKEFLQDIFDPGGYIQGEGLGASRDYCTTGRNNLNSAHFFLASLLELQQTGELWELRPFCRTIFTTNFDTLLQDALQLVNVLYCLTDRPERGLDPSDFPADDRAMHLVYTHGSILRHNAASTTDDLAKLSEKNTEPIRSYIEPRDVLVLGYGGWDDSLMSSLSRCDKTKHRIYWCNVYSADEAKTSLAPAVLQLLEASNGRAVYVPLGSEGADGFMARLYQALAPTGRIPTLLSDPIGVFGRRLGRLKLDNLVLAPPDSAPPLSGALPHPRLERSAMLIHSSVCRVLGAARTYFFRSGSDPEKQTYAQSIGQALALLEEGFALALAGNEDEAVQVWSRVLESNGPAYETALAANYIGIVNTRAGRDDLAIAAYTRAIDLGWSSPALQVEALTGRGTARHQSGQMDLEVEDFSHAIEIWEDHPPAVHVGLIARALIYRGLMHEIKGDPRRAKEDFDRARELKDVPLECMALIARPRV
jgi:tetratricopeptide (TPR) repeat protein